ncbi:MAG: LysR family transcriptional regulator [Deltaproteobacteria bacterium]|nr:LysR family transcriptional regulator [Deltaproteobacteria bacterium]
MTMNLDQLQAFVATAQNGSFSAAGRKLGKAQSAISTAVINLEIDLDLKLFDRSTKYPRLTSEGEALLRDAERTLKRAEFFISKATCLSNGVEQRVGLTIDDLVLIDDLELLLSRFGEQFPFVELEILRSSLGDAAKMVASGRADIGIMAPIDLPSNDANYRLVTNVSFIPAVNANHALANHKIVKISDLEPHRQIVETSRGGDREPPGYIRSQHIWYAESLQVACDLIRKGLGWGVVPRRLIHKDLKSGKLINLPLEISGADFNAPIYLVWSKNRRLGKAVQWLLNGLMDFYSRN